MDTLRLPTAYDAGSVGSLPVWFWLQPFTAYSYLRLTNVLDTVRADASCRGSPLYRVYALPLVLPVDCWTTATLPLPRILRPRSYTWT